LTVTTAAPKALPSSLLTIPLIVASAATIAGAATKPRRKPILKPTVDIVLIKVDIFGSAPEFVETLILGCFLKNDELGLCDRHALSLEQQVAEILVAAAQRQYAMDKPLAVPVLNGDLLPSGPKLCVDMMV